MQNIVPFKPYTLFLRWPLTEIVSFSLFPFTEEGILNANASLRIFNLARPNLVEALKTCCKARFTSAFYLASDASDLSDDGSGLSGGVIAAIVIFIIIIAVAAVVGALFFFKIM